MRTRAGSVAAALALLLLVLTACDSAGRPRSFATAVPPSTSRPPPAEPAVPSSSPGPSTPVPRPTPEPTGEPTAEPAPDDDGGQPVVLGCLASCHVTLVGHGAGASFRGTRISLQSAADGRADLRVGEQDVSCAAGEAVAVPPLRFTCTAVTDDAVMLTLATS